MSTSGTEKSLKGKGKLAGAMDAGQFEGLARHVALQNEPTMACSRRSSNAKHASDPEGGDGRGQRKRAFCAVRKAPFSDIQLRLRRSQKRPFIPKVSSRLVTPSRNSPRGGFRRSSCCSGHRETV